LFVGHDGHQKFVPPAKQIKRWQGEKVAAQVSKQAQPKHDEY